MSKTLFDDMPGHGPFLTDLPSHLRKGADKIEADGHVSTARYMREAAHEIGCRREHMANMSLKSAMLKRLRTANEKKKTR